MSGPIDKWYELYDRYVEASNRIASVDAEIYRAEEAIKSADYSAGGTGRFRSSLLPTSDGADLSPTTVVSTLRQWKQDLQEEQTALIGQMAQISPELTIANFPERYADVASALPKVSAPSYQFQIAENGNIYRMGSDGSFQFVRNDPAFARKNVQVVNDQTTGRSYALTLDSDGKVVSRTDLGQYAYPEVDPERRFRAEVLANAASVEASWAGVDLQMRGQELTALANDMAYQIEIGAMTYTEAQLNINRIQAALTQRREERQQLLDYGVTRESLRTRPSGEVVTELPFASTIRGILRQATGRDIPAEDFELGVTNIDPDAAARGLIAGSAYDSPIPALVSNLTSYREAVANILAQQPQRGQATEDLAALAAEGN